MSSLGRNDIKTMLNHFKEIHGQANRALIENGEGKRCVEWKNTSIQVEDIVYYLYKIKIM